MAGSEPSPDVTQRRKLHKRRSTTDIREPRPSPDERPQGDVIIHEHAALTARSDASIHEQVTPESQHSATAGKFPRKASRLSRHRLEVPRVKWV
jgi:hypothetical protein